MSSMNVSVGGLNLKNPLMVASGPLGAKLDLLKEAEENGFAAVTLKHVMAFQRFMAKPRWFFDRQVGVIVSGDPRLTPEYAPELVRQAKEQTGLTIICNMSGAPNDLESWGNLAKLLEEAGADAVELNFNCPNLMSANSKLKGAQGANLGSDPESCRQVVAEVKKATTIPVITKLSTESGKIIPVAQAVVSAGADILNVHASYRCAPGIDIYRGGRLMYPGSDTGNFGGMSGVWGRRASNRFICDVARAGTGKPVIGGSGLYTWQDVVEAIMYGAEAVQMCTSVIQNGFGIARTILDGLERFMEEQGYESIHDMAGLAGKYVCAPGEMEYRDVAARIDEEKCTGCRLCTKIASCNAIAYRAADKKCVVDESKCVACGFCRGVCPREAITYAEKGKETEL